jgi:hypothetical protein
VAFSLSILCNTLGIAAEVGSALVVGSPVSDKLNHSSVLRHIFNFYIIIVLTEQMSSVCSTSNRDVKGKNVYNGKNKQHLKDADVYLL